VSLPKRIEQVVLSLRGWRNYFGSCHTPQVLSTLDAWIRRRLRMYLWRQWKTGRNHFKELRFVVFRLNPPKRLSSTRPDLARYAIDVCEQDPPAEEHPLKWRLLTNLTIANFAPA
jgi:Group II intron, maturase-specific domain